MIADSYDAGQLTSPNDLARRAAIVSSRAASAFSSLSAALGKEVRYVDVPPEAVKEAMLRGGVPEWRADALNEYATAHSEGYSDFTTDNVERLTGHPATFYKQFTRDFEQRFHGGCSD